MPAVVMAVKSVSVSTHRFGIMRRAINLKPPIKAQTIPKMARPGIPNFRANPSVTAPGTTNRVSQRIAFGFQRRKGWIGGGTIDLASRQMA